MMKNDPRFIEVTEKYTRNKHYLNIQKIVEIRQHDIGTMIYMEYSDGLFVEDSYTDVQRKIVKAKL